MILIQSDGGVNPMKSQQPPFLGKVLVQGSASFINKGVENKSALLCGFFGF